MKNIVALSQYYSEQSVESCMLPSLPHEKDELWHRIFKEYPLLGDYVLSETQYKKYHQISKNIIDNKLKELQDKSYHVSLQTAHHEVLTLVIIALAKKWDTSKESSFSKYVALDFGYNDESNRKRVWSIITKSLDLALNRNKKLFITHGTDREFYETVMVHSFGPSEAWNPLFDLLLNFYKENLTYYYDPNDPLFSVLVKTLRSIFSNDTDEEHIINIASRQYLFRVCIRRLVQNCPNYCVVIFKDLVKRIHQLINGEVVESDRYIISLLDSWYANRTRYSSFSASAHKQLSGDIAFDYSALDSRIKYYLSANDLFLRIPTIRIENERINDAHIDIMICGHEFNKTLELFGNELGRTIFSSQIKLDTELFSGDLIDIRLKIYVGNQLKYDSFNKLNRQVLFFSDSKEIRVNSLALGKYTMVSPTQISVSGNGVDIDNFSTHISYVTIHKGFELKVNDRTVSLDSSSVVGAKIVPPDYSDCVRYEYSGKIYRIIDRGSTLKFYSKCLQDYSVAIDDQVHGLDSFKDELAGNRAVISFANTNSSVSTVEIHRNKDKAVVFSENYSFVNLKYRFNKDYYSNLSSLNNGRATLWLDDQKYYLDVEPGSTTVVKELPQGRIVISVPFINGSFVKLDNRKNGCIWCDEISQESALCFNRNVNYDYSVVIGEDEYHKPDVVALDKYKKRADDKQTEINLVFKCGEESYCFGKVLYEPCFTSSPVVSYSDYKLSCFWDSCYVGSQTDLVLTIFGDGYKHSFSLINDGCCSNEFYIDDFSEGEYEYTISNVRSDKVLLRDRVFIGGEKYSRFFNRTVCLKYITEDDESSTDALEIKPVYIEDISYVNTQYVNSEDGIFDIYSGRMYYLNNSGDKVYYSSEYNETKHKYMVNPVKIIYLNDHYLRIVNQDDEGLYCFSYVFNDKDYHQISDTEPQIGSKKFSDVLFFLNEGNIPSASNIDIINDDSFLNSSEENSCKSEGENDMKRVRVIVKQQFSNWENVDQMRVITASPSERIIVNAGPGTGKTWALIEKIIYMVNDQGVDPECIQVLCFSRAAVEEIRNRMRDAILSGRASVHTNNVDIRTFDSFATQFLYWVKDSDYTIIRKDYPIEKLNYDERIEKFAEVIRKEPGIIEQCEHLIVDEVQDLVLCRAQLVLDMISCIPKEAGVTLLGDCCQAIYGYQVEGNGINTEEFYGRIYADKDFTRYKFSVNHRQAEYWDNVCKQYRSSIMSFIDERCNDSLKSINDKIPEYDIPKVSSFDEESLLRLSAEGGVAILTRSNAQLLEVAEIFKKKSIDYVLNRKRNESKLNKWVGYVFNESRVNSYNKDDLYAEIEKQTLKSPAPQDFDEVWGVIDDAHRHSTGRINSRDILISIRNRARNRILFLDEPDGKTIISTVHRSKGREYNNVLVDKNLIASEKEDLEEHRVAYVALSRAKNNVYAVELPECRFMTLNNRRCFSYGYNSKGKYLTKIEVGFDEDFDDYSFCSIKGIQSIIRGSRDKLIGNRVYLKKSNTFSSKREYLLILEKTNTQVAVTGESFLNDLEQAIRCTKNLPPYKMVYDYMFPERFENLTISDIASSIGMIRGEESGVIEYGDTICWNTLVIEGYARAEYR